MTIERDLKTSYLEVDKRTKDIIRKILKKLEQIEESSSDVIYIDNQESRYLS